MGEKSIYKSLAEWNKSSKKAHSAYNAAHKQGLIPLICEKFGWTLPKQKKENGYWNLERCQFDALKYNTPSNWQKNSLSAYTFAHKNGLLNICCKHMTIRKSKPTNFWNFDNCKKEALKYSSKKEWKDNSKSSYNSALKNKWLSELCLHMITTRLPVSFFTKEKCKEEALKYSGRFQWQKNSPLSYSAARKKGWLDECCIHMLATKKIPGYWTFERCKTDALNYTSRTEWYKKSNGAYRKACDNEWIDECCKHMNNKKKNVS